MNCALRSTSLRNVHKLYSQSARCHSTSSVSQSELSHFAALASSWWDPNGPSRLLHLMNPLRHHFITSCLATMDSAISGSNPTQGQSSKKTSGGLRFLDVGCGGGIFAESAARLLTTSTVTAIDPTPEVIQIAKEHARQDPLLVPPRLQYLNTPIEQLPLPESSFEAYDVVTLFEVIEHVSSPSRFLSQCLKQVKPGGWIIGSTIARSWTSWLTTKLVAEDIVGIVPKRTHEWEKYINPEELSRWFRGRDAWTAEERILGVFYVPGLGWQEVRGGEAWGNYFWGFRRHAH